jgi:hypothetical protein
LRLGLDDGLITPPMVCCAVPVFGNPDFPAFFFNLNNMDIAFRKELDKFLYVA